MGRALISTLEAAHPFETPLSYTGDDKAIGDDEGVLFSGKTPRKRVTLKGTFPNPVASRRVGHFIYLVMKPNYKSPRIDRALHLPFSGIPGPSTYEFYAIPLPQCHIPLSSPGWTY